MRVTNFSLKRDYEIKCKAFMPENEIRHVILGVHGFAGDKESSMLSSLAEAFSKKGVMLICFDFPAHGESPTDTISLKNCKADLCAVADYIREKYPTQVKSLFATSFGGYVSLLCYEQLGDFSYVLRAPAVTMPRLLLENVLKLSAEEFKDQGSIVCGFERKITLPYSFYKELLREKELINKSFSSPISIIHGNKDDIVPLEDIISFKNAHNTVSLFVIEGADHRFKNPGEIQKVISLTKEILKI